MKILITLFAAMLLATASLVADGNDLLEECLAAERIIDGKTVNELEGGKAMRCFGVIYGVRETMRMIDHPSYKMCMPERGIQNKQALRIVVSYLKKNPQNLHFYDISLIMAAYIKAFPCK